jgi:hypothetical protein
MDKRNLVVITKMDKSTGNGSPGIKMVRKNVIISTIRGKETKAGQCGGPMETEKSKEISRKG